MKAKLVLLVLAVAAALALTGAALGGGQSYMDSSGEVPGSADVTGTSVTDDGSTITFQVQTNLGDWAPNTFFAVLVNSDQNDATGTAGFDYIVTGDHFGGTVVSTGTRVVVQTPSSLSNGLWTVSLPASVIGNPSAFSFFVLTQAGPDPAHPYEDRAPDSGTWAYPAAPAPTPTPTPVPPPAPAVSSVVAAYGAMPVHGKAFRVYGLNLTLSDGTKATASHLVCRATLAGSQFLGGGLTGCAFKLPKSAKGKRLSVTVSGSYLSASLTKSYAFRVR
ncbi:MAG TPA: hypothetical protein VGU02_04020 [Gaiellaceae bacterium]|nr:hypothetical protein [Gaiellaceae bacterium]